MTRPIISVLAAVLFTLIAACEVAIEAVEESLAPEDAVVHARRCSNCGWIESKREIAVADPHAPRAYEYTVRMMDGSSSVFQQALPATWRLRERLSVM